jgi:hypothetical protein
MESPPQPPADLALSSRCPRRSRLCECGCGQETPLASKTQTSKGWVKGCPVRFVSGHQARTQQARASRDPATGCLLWRGRLTDDGYPEATINGATLRLHRYAWEYVNGPVPEGMVLDHRCRSRACLNPHHLEPVTPAENVRRGALARLTPWHVGLLKRFATAGLMSDRELAAVFGISVSHAGNIRSGRRWAGIPPLP